MNAAVAAPTLLSAAQPVIEANEGRRLTVYRDSLGIPTIGIGFNLQYPIARELCQGCGADYDALLAGTASLTGAQCDYLFQQLAIDVLEWLTLLFPAFFSYSQARQIALLDMGFNMGDPRFKGFRMMISAILAGYWAQASEQALRSVWAGQVGQRAIQDAKMLVEG